MGLAEVITSIWQSEEAKKLKEEMGAMPEYVIPEEYKNILTDAQLAAAENLPAGVKQSYIENVVRAQEQSLQGVSDRKGGLTGLGNLNSQANDAYKDLMMADYNASVRNKSNLANARQLVGNSEETKNMMEINKWKSDDAYQKAMTGAAFQNFSTGISDIKNTVLGMFSPTGGQDTPQAQAPQSQQIQQQSGGGTGQVAPQTSYAPQNNYDWMNEGYSFQSNWV